MQLRDIAWSLNHTWCIEDGQILANQLYLSWTQELQHLVLATRQFYEKFAHSPNTRVLVKYLGSRVSTPTSSIHLQALLKDNPALVLCYLAGIPKPRQCF